MEDFRQTLEAFFKQQALETFAALNRRETPEVVNGKPFIRPPEDYEWDPFPFDYGMSNLEDRDYDYTKLEEHLRSHKLVVQYSAWEFCARVWWDQLAERFRVFVDRYNVTVDQGAYESLHDLRHAVANAWGWD